MKRIYTILAALLLTFTTQAQSPEKMSYQAVIRDGNNQVTSSTNISTRISLLKGTTDGAAVYRETHTGTTNANGLLTLNIGVGTSSDDFSSIDWSQGPYFIKTETDPSGGTNYNIIATSQLLSVPYALHSKTAEKAKNGIDAGTNVGAMNYWNGTAWVEVAPTVNEGATLQFVGGKPKWIGGTPPPSIGDTHAGGIVFYVADTPTDLDGDGELDTGLVCAFEDQSSGVKWKLGNGASSVDKIGSWFPYVGRGATNTASIIAAQGEGSYAASVASAYDGGGFDDWFLPSKEELNLMYLNLKAKGLGGFTNGVYWSSSEGEFYTAWRQYFNSGNPHEWFKINQGNVRAVRAF